MPERIRVGIIGANVNYGWGNSAHLPALKNLPEFEVVAVCTSREETAKQTAEKYGIPLAFHDPEALAACRDVDLVDVCLRVPYHHQMVMIALRAGKHVFCEWPLGANLKEATGLRDRAKMKKVLGAIGLQGRGSPVFNYLKDLLAQGYIGQVLSCAMVGSAGGAARRSASYAWAVDPAKGANVLTIQALHAIDPMCFAVADFRELSAVIGTQTKEAVVPETGEKITIQSPDHVLISGALTNGALASVYIASVPYHGTGFSLEIHGTDGTLVVTGAGAAHIGNLVLRGARGSDKSLEVMPVPGSYRRVPAAVPDGPPLNVAQILMRQAESILGKTPLDGDFDLAVRRHELVDAIQRASVTGRRQTM